MTKAGATRRERKQEQKRLRSPGDIGTRLIDDDGDPIDVDGEKMRTGHEESPGSSVASTEEEGGVIARPVPQDCSYCRRAPNCAVWLGFAEAVNAALGNASTRIPGIELEPSLKIINCPEFDVTPEVEAKLREQMAIMPAPELAAAQE